MYLAKVEGTEVPDGSEGTAFAAKWQAWAPSTLAHHGEACCDIAKEWFAGIDLAQLGDGAASLGPRWLKHRYPWGPLSWPLHWCEAARAEKLDCGAHAAIAHFLFSERGVSSRPAQIVQRYDGPAASHWADGWRDKDVEPDWIEQDMIYHEACAIDLDAGEIKVFDASSGWWIDPRQQGGYGSLAGLRVAGRDGELLTWGKWLVPANSWLHIPG